MPLKDFYGIIEAHFYARRSQMSKKFQVVLPDWMEEYLEALAARYDLTISELLRLELSLAFICFVNHFYPEYEGPTFEDLGVPTAKEAPTLENLDREKMHKVLSRFYFEARKASDYHMKNEDLRK
jgi:hypothetical protein